MQYNRQLACRDSLRANLLYAYIFCYLIGQKNVGRNFGGDENYVRRTFCPTKDFVQTKILPKCFVLMHLYTLCVTKRKNISRSENYGISKNKQYIFKTYLRAYIYSSTSKGIFYCKDYCYYYWIVFHNLLIFLSMFSRF